MSGATQPDHYAVLEISLSASLAEIKKAFNRLALLRHPDKDLGNPRAGAAFRELREAFDVLRDPEKRKRYDVSFQWTNGDRKAPPGSRHDGHTKPRAESTEDRAERAWEEIRQRESRARSVRKQQLAAEERDKMFEMQKVERKTRELERQVHESVRVEKEASERIQNSGGWWGYLASLTSGKAATANSKLRMEKERLQASATGRIREERLKQERRKLQVMQGEVEALSRRRQELEEQDARDEKERASRARAKQQREHMEQVAQQEERTAKAREQAARDEKVRAEEFFREGQRQQEERDRARREAGRRARERAGTARENEGTWHSPFGRHTNERTAHEWQNTTAGGSARDCLHQGFWPRQDGPATCGLCGRYYRQWILTCPSCHMTACASCRPTLQGKPSRPSQGYFRG